MTEPAGIVDRLRARIGIAGPDRTSLVEAGHVRRFCEAVGDDDPRWRELAPPTFVVAIGIESLDLPEALEYGKGWLNGGDRFEFLEPIRIGDTITSRTTLRDVYEKEGGSGSLLFLINETTFVRQDGRLAVRVKGTRIRR